MEVSQFLRSPLRMIKWCMFNLVIFNLCNTYAMDGSKLEISKVDVTFNLRLRVVLNYF